MLPRTAYIHVPFCAHHCGYCDFAVIAGHDHLIDLYLEALACEFATLGSPHTVESLFIGGGTPTHLNPDQLRRLLETITRWFPLEPQREFSIEANPDSLSEEKTAILAAYGVNRVSIGVQSFHMQSLESLDRRHTSEHIPRAVEAVRKHIANVSFDLIFAAPGSTLASWQHDLESALAFRPEHISTYGLTYEKGTPLWKQQHRGTLIALSEDDELAMYEYAMDRLTHAGYEHYEISNFAKPGFRCRHNERYWANEGYYGFGVGAARYVNGVRELNVRDTKLYIRKAIAGEPVTFQSEELDPRARAFETLATQLRRADGIIRDCFREQTGYDADTLAPAAFALLRENGLVTDNGVSLQLTRPGKCVADAAVMEILKHSG